MSDADVQDQLFLIGSWQRLGLAQGLGGMEGAEPASTGPSGDRWRPVPAVAESGRRARGVPALALQERRGVGGRELLEGDVNLGRALERLAGTPSGRRLGLTDPDRQFADFFATHGGSWEEFPSFHVSNLPIHSDRHIGSHSLVEGVVMAYWLTGEPRFREVALAAARHHVDLLVPSELEQHGWRLRNGDPMRSRALGWPLVNLTRLWEMTEGMPGESDLHRDIRRTADDVVRFLRSIPVARHIGVIHLGVTLEGLTSYVRLTGHRAARDYLVELARHWATEYDPRRGIIYRSVEDQVGGTQVSNRLVLLGFAYALSVDDSPTLRKVTRELEGQMPDADKAKAFAMAFRSSPQAFWYLERAKR